MDVSDQPGSRIGQGFTPAEVLEPFHAAYDHPDGREQGRQENQWPQDKADDHDQTVQKSDPERSYLVAVMAFGSSDESVGGFEP